MKTNGLEIIEADLLFDPLEVQNIEPIATISPHPSKILLTRDHNFVISARMEGEATSENRPIFAKEIIPGTITRSESTKGIYAFSCEVALRGITSHRYTVQHREKGSSFTLNGRVQSVEVNYNNDSDVETSVMYMLGIPSGNFPEGTRRDSNAKTVMTRPGLPEMGAAQTIEVSGPGNSMNMAVDSLLIKSKSGVALFCKGLEYEASSKLSPSYLHFVSGEPVRDHKARQNFLQALSFCLGKRFIEVGHTELDVNNYLIRRSARCPYSSNVHREANIHDLPPTRITSEEEYLMGDEIGNLIDLFLDKRSELALNDVMWNVWAARMMPVGLQLVAYAAALESLINSWFERPENTKRKVYIPEKEFSDYTEEPFNELSMAVPSSDEWKKVINRMKYMNQITVSDRYKRFFSDLGLKIGKVEEATMASRHKFAHGGAPDEEKLEELIVMARAYQTLINRSLLRVIQFKGTYCDYSTKGFPYRNLEDCMGGPEGNGKI